MNIYSKLSDWQKRGLITAEQQQKITDYENNVRRPMLYHALLFLSCFCIGIGVIAVIAANWEAIPAAVKLGVDFALLCTAAWGVWHSRRKGRNLAAEALLTAFALLVLGSIGLVGQIYHLPAHGLSALLFWSVLTFPLLFLSSKPLFPGLWFIGFFLSLYDRLSDYRWFADIIDRLFDRNANFGIWSGLFAMLVFYRLLQMLPHPAIQKAWRHLTVFAFAFCAFVLDAFSLKDWSCFRTDNVSLGWTVWGLSALALAGFAFACRKTSLRPGIAAAAVIFVYAFLTDMLPAWEDETSALMMIALLSVAGIYAYRHNYPRLLNVSTVLIALRFFGVYLEVFGSILSTGMGLIVAQYFSRQNVSPSGTFLAASVYTLIPVFALYWILRILPEFNGVRIFSLEMPPQLWLYFVIYTLASYVAPNLLLFANNRNVSPVIVGMLLLLEPVTGLFLDWMFLGKPLTWNILLGGAIILISNAVLIRTQE